MTIPLIINGTTYNYPENTDIRWGSTATAWAAAVTSGMLQKAGGTFTLLADVNFGPTYGLLSPYYKSLGTNIATSGIVRLANAEAVSWRNAANSANLALAVDSSDKLTFNGSALAFDVGDTTTIDLTLTAGVVTANINALSITDSLISASAAITRSKLASGTANYVLINNGSGVMSQEATLAASRGGLATDASAFTGLVKASAGVFSAATLVNADVSSSAAIARSKLASGSNNYVVINNGSGVMSEEAALAASRGGLATDASAFTGVVKASAGVFTAATVVNADVSSSAAIARTKLASGSNNYVVINNGSGVMSEEAQLAGTRGGSGVSNSGTFTWGSNNITVTTGGATTVTWPTSGTFATLAGAESLSNKTLVAPAVAAASATVGGGITLFEGTNNGTNKVNLKAPDSIGTDFDFNLPATAGNSGEVLTSAGAGATPTWTAPLVNPMDGVGQFIIGGTAGAATKFAHPGAANYVMNTTSSTGVSWTLTPTVTTLNTTGASGYAGANSSTVVMGTGPTFSGTSMTAQKLSLGDQAITWSTTAQEFVINGYTNTASSNPFLSIQKAKISGGAVANSGTSDILGGVKFSNYNSGFQATSEILGGVDGSLGNGYLSFQTASSGVFSEALNINSSQQCNFNALAFFNAASGASARITGATDGTAALAVNKSSSTSGSGQAYVSFRYNNNSTASGFIVGSSTNAVVFATAVSDARVKTNVQRLQGEEYLAKILALKPSSFDYIPTEGICEAGSDIGLIAQEVAEIFPENVFKIENDYFSISGWDREKVILITAIKALNAKIEYLASSIQQLIGADHAS